MENVRHDRAYLYKVNFNELLEHLADTGFKVRASKAESVFITGLDTENFLTFDEGLLLQNSNYDDMNYAALRIALMDKLSFLNDIAIRTPRHALYQWQWQQAPLLRSKANMEYLLDKGIQPWHHMWLCGDKVIVYVWDTREVVMVLDNSELEDLSLRMTKPANDNNLPLAWPEGVEPIAWQPSSHPCLHGCPISAKLQHVDEVLFQN